MSSFRNSFTIYENYLIASLSIAFSSVNLSPFDHFLFVDYIQLWLISEEILTCTEVNAYFVFQTVAQAFPVSIAIFDDP